MAPRISGLRRTAILCLVSLAGAMANPAWADSGFFLGGSVGQAEPDITFEEGSFEADATAWKLFGGYNFDVTLVNLAVEAAWVDFGSPSGRISGIPVGLEAEALTGFGVAGLDLGIFGLFAKAGLAYWDAEARVAGLGSTTDDDSGTDPAYGIGARVTVGSAEFRAEYEYFDIDAVDAGSSELSMLSLGAAWTF